MEITNQTALIKDTIRTLKLGKIHPRAVAVILLAPPGAGKYELADRLEQELGLTHVKVDDLKHFLAPKSGVLDDLDFVTDFALAVMVELTRMGYSSVLDRNVNRKGYREKFKLDIKAVGGELVEIVINCPDDVAFGNIKADNSEFVGGEKEGNILDRSYWEFKKSQVEPPIGENRYELSCQYSPEDWQRLQGFLKLKLTSS